MSYTLKPAEHTALALGNALDNIQDILHLCCLGNIRLSQDEIHTLENAEKVLMEHVDIPQINELRARIWKAE